MEDTDTTQCWVASVVCPLAGSSVYLIEYAEVAVSTIEFILVFAANKYIQRGFVN